MTYLTAILYGLVQGITEFLPVSSSGHLCIFEHFFGMEDFEANYFTFNILLHLATLIAVFLVYWRDIFPLIPAFFTLIGKGCRNLAAVIQHKKRSPLSHDEKFVWFVILGTLPLVAAMLFKDSIEVLYDHVRLIGGILIFNGLVLWISDRLAHGQKGIEEAKPRNALTVGLCQMCAILPGLSRSGSTITGGLTQGFSREFAVKFSFILSIPAILGANILEVPTMLHTPVSSGDLGMYVAGMLAAALSGIAAMKLLIYIAKKNNFRIFSYYCVIVGLLTIIFA